MNKRILELAEQSGLVEMLWIGVDGHEDDVAFQKFVELAIREFAYDCIDVTNQGDKIQWIASKWGVKI